MPKYKSIFTRAVHGGERGPRPDFKPVSSPIYNSVGYLYEDLKDLDAVFANERPGYVYARYGTPTHSALEEVLADLEEGEAALSFGSGMAAVYAAILAAGVKTGSALLSAYDVYGATYTLCARLLPDWGVKTGFVDANDLRRVETALREMQPAAVIVETISNPLMKVADVPAIVELAHRAGAKVIVDNTFATPVLFQPLKCGVDFCVHSTTKYLGGHGDVLGGAVVTSAENRKTLHEIIKMTGGNLGPTEAWLTLRGIKTLPLRMRQHCANAMEVAKRLQAHPQILKVNYPGLAGHPQHELGGRLFAEGLFGGMISFEIRNAGRAEVFRFMESLKLILPATTLGDVYSLTLYPAMSSHRGLSPEERRKVGISDSLVRLSVGIEEAEEIIGDLEQALEKIK
ncbi:MAG: PLP-dependent aspartate aminotransferase family protein [Desulfobacterota bacterium]|nr:PLP-dependent aspartate aminotransferase family protein [Thermodesulfobacteriota bacterium]